MTATADIRNSSTSTSTTSTPITLPQLLAAIQSAVDSTTEAFDTMVEALDAVEEIQTTLVRVKGPLHERIEAGRRRSARCRRNRAAAESNDNGNGHHGDFAVTLTRHGVMLTCRRCGRAVAS